jgi:hypothetical protein
MSGVPKFASVRLDARREAELRARVVAQEAARVRDLEERRRRRAAEVEERWRRRAAEAEERRRTRMEEVEERQRRQTAAVEQQRADAQRRRDEAQLRREELQARRREEQAQRAAARAAPAGPPPAAAEPPAGHAEPPPEERVEPPAPAVAGELLARAAAALADAELLQEELGCEQLTGAASRLAAARQGLDAALEAGEAAGIEAAVGLLLAGALADGRRELHAAVERRERHAVVVQALMGALPADLVVDAGSLRIDGDGTTRVSAYAPGSALHVAVTSDADGSSRLVYTLEGPAVQRTQHEDGSVSCDSHEQMLTAVHAAMQAHGVQTGPLDWAGRGGGARRPPPPARAPERGATR